MKAEKVQDSFLTSLPVIGPWFKSQLTPAPVQPKGVIDLIYATGETISSVMGGTVELGFNATRATVSLGLGIGSGLARVAQKTTAIGGSILTLVMAYDSYIHLSGQESLFHRMNPCEQNVNFPTFVNLFSNLNAKICTEPDFLSDVKRAMNLQVLLVPVALGLTYVTSHAFRLLAEGFSSWNRRLYSSEQKEVY